MLKISSNINRTFVKKNINLIFSKKVKLIFLYILPSPLYTAAIAQAASLHPSQKEFLLAYPAVVAQEKLTSSSALKRFPARASLSVPNR
jgi:hypothetical protein